MLFPCSDPLLTCAHYWYSVALEKRLEQAKINAACITSFLLVVVLICGVLLSQSQAKIKDLEYRLCSKIMTEASHAPGVETTIEN